MLHLLLACVASKSPASLGSTPAETADSAATLAPDYGVVTSCSSSPGDGYNQIVANSSAVMVHGDSAEQAAMAQGLASAYRPLFDEFELVAASDISDAQRQQDLLILGSPKDNPLLLELNGHLPVWFEDDSFTFGGYRYTERGHGLGLIHPSPWAQGRHVVLFAGNSHAGSFATTTVHTGASDYVTVRGWGTEQQRGFFCRDGERWGFLATRDSDQRAAWDAWAAGLQRFEGPSHLFMFEEDSPAARNIEGLAEAEEQELQRVLELLQVEPLTLPIKTFYYSTNALKETHTGDPGNAQANTLNLEVHEVFGQVNAAGVHEDTHVVAWHRLGHTHNALLGEGLAVWASGGWHSETLDHWASLHRDSGELPTLTAMLADFRSIPDLVGYPSAGHFVQFVHDRWGLNTLKQLYVLRDIPGGSEQLLGMSMAELEAAWVQSIP